MLRSSIIGLTAALLLVGCSKEPEHRYDEPLTQNDYDRKDLIEEHRALKVSLAGQHEFYVAGPATEQDDCARCHKPGEEPYRDETLPPGKDAHWDIIVDHAPDMDCFACHQKEDPAKLVSVVDKDADMESMYLHCGSCHKDQFESWIGGAHGKRLTGWDGVRIVENCNACHDPHSPSRETTLPVAQPTITPERAKGH